MRGPLWSPFGCPLPVLPPEGAVVHASPLPLLDICAHGPGEGETQAGRGLHLVGAAEVHSKDILPVKKKHLINPGVSTAPRWWAAVQEEGSTSTISDSTFMAYEIF